MNIYKLFCYVRLLPFWESQNYDLANQHNSACMQHRQWKQGKKHLRSFWAIVLLAINRQLLFMCYQEYLCFALTFHLHFVMVLINPLNTELNPTCHLQALLGAHHILHISRIRVKEQTQLRRALFEKLIVIQLL
jgi:hypothetical protein